MKQKAADDLAAEKEKADIQMKLALLSRLQEDLQKAQAAAQENLEAAIVVNTMSEKGIINIDNAFNVTLT